MDDAELLRDYAENHSETAFAGFVERRIGFVYAAALRMVGGDAHTAQDVTQAVFVLAANRAAALAGHERLAGWLYTATRNVSRETLREARRRDAREQEAARMSEIGQSGEGEGVADEARLRPLLDEALGALREGEREAVLLRYFEGMGFAGIGVRLKMSEEAARKRVARAVEKMRAVFARRGVTSSAAAVGALMSAEAAQGAPVGLAASVSAGAGVVGVASAGFGAGAFLGFMGFMSSAKITVVAVVALLLAAGGAVYVAQGGRATSAALARARLENASLQTQLREAEKQGAADGRAATRREREAATLAFLADNPVVKEKMAAWDKAVGMRSTFWIAHEMKLSPEQGARLAELASMGGYGMIESVPGYGEVMLSLGSRLASSKREQALRDLLGDEGYEKYSELAALDNGGAFFNVQKLGAALCFTDAPLTSEQARSLNAIGRDCFEQLVRDMKKTNSHDTDPQARWNAFMEQARPVLSARQMSALVEIGDRYVWRSVRDKWTEDYNKAHTITTKTPPQQ